MAFDADRVETLTFDSYSTVVDVEATERALAAVTGGESEESDDTTAVARLWRNQSLTYTMVANEIDAYEPFYELNRRALTYALEAHGYDVSADRRDEILSVYHELDVFDDVREGLERLTDAGYDCYVLSNGNPEMLDSMVEHADIGDLLTETVSADEIERYKPAAELYELAADRADTPVENVAHTTAAWFDVEGAQHAGMQGVWADRKSLQWGGLAGAPDLTVTTFTELADALGA
ncbi:haloacid dehalogenase type II [Haloprofundus halobius]|uniref:haloacid dehalogenase type II n=1 Tax=Haloprofundus halobius TaxID=2876194 RepID=UPI001CCF8E60|nr:haloacid dehalogenase type II [Haloprofundus halobius]